MWFTKLSKEEFKEAGFISKPYFRQNGLYRQRMENWPDQDLIPPARMSLGRIYEAIATYTVSDFSTSPSASLDFSDVKEVGSYMVKPGETEATTPAKLPEYVNPKPGERIEQDLGAKRPPLADDEYIAHFDRKTNLADMAAKVVPGSTSKDFIMDRRAMITLLDYLNHTLTKTLNTSRPSNAQSAVDLVKISKSPGGGLVVDALYNRVNLIAEGMPYHGKLFRAERSHRGSYFNAWRRHATGGKAISYLCTGKMQIAGNSAGEEPESFRFTEFELGGLKFLMRAPAHCERDGKSVELGTTHWAYQDDYSLLRTYQKMMLGKVDKFSLAIQGSGRIRHIIENQPEDLVAKNPAIKECADKRYGRLVDLLKKVSGAISGDGPWVLQWQAGEVKLGKYEVTEDPDKVDEEEKEEDVIMA